MDQESKTARARRYSNLISNLLHPFLTPIYSVVVLLWVAGFFSYYSLRVKLYVLGVVVLYTTVIPTLVIALLRSMGRVSDRELSLRGERFVPLFVSTICYAMCAYTLLRIPSAEFIFKIMFAASLSCLICLVVSLWWKISIHLTSMGAMVAFAGVVCGVGAVGVWFLLATIVGAGLLASARLYLGHHNGWQVLAGFSAGFVAMFGTMVLA